MEQSNSLLLNETALQLRPESEKSLFVLEWLRHLHKILSAVTRADIKGVQKKLQEQLVRQLLLVPGPPIRYYLARCLASLFAVGDSVGLFEIINTCNDQIKQKDDPATLNNRLAALEVLGEMYDRLGRMVGRSYDETVAACSRNLKSAESQTRIEIMRTLEKVVHGMGSAVSHLHKEIYKHLRTCMTDRVMAVREAAAHCMEALAQNSVLFSAPSDLETAISLCCRAMENSTYDVRCAVASLAAALLAAVLSTGGPGGGGGKTGPTATATAAMVKGQKGMTVDEVLNLLASMFLKGGLGGFLKTGAGEMIRGTTVVTKEVRIGAAHAYIAFFKRMGAHWTERNLALILNHLMDLVGNPRSSMTHVDAIYARKCVSCIFQASIADLLTEKAQLLAGQELLTILYKSATAPDVASDSSSAENRNADSKLHVLISALEQLQRVIVDLDSMAVALNSDSSTLNLIDVSLAIVVYPSPNVQLAAAWTLRCIITALPTQVVPVFNRLLAKIDDTKTFPEGIVGYSCGLAAVIGGIADSPLGIPHRLVERAFSVAEDLLRSAALNSRLSQQRTEAAWMILGAITTLGSPCLRKYLAKYLLLWRTSFPRSDKEIESEKLRGDAFTWQVSLQNRAGALAALNGLLTSCPELLTEDVLRKIMVPVQSAIALLHNISGWIGDAYGAHLKVYLAGVRMRLYETLLKLTAKSCLTNYSTVITGVINDFTLVENQSHTTTSLLRGLCRNEDALLLGQWLQDTDQKLIEEQLQPNSASGSGSLEHDATAVYKRRDTDSDGPCPLPIGVAVIDNSLLLFGKIFVFLPTKHQQQILEHLALCLKQAKSQRLAAMQINVFAGLLSALKCLNDAKNELLTEPVVSAFVNLIQIGIVGSPMMRCAAGEALGRLAQVVGEPKFVAETVQRSFDMLHSSRDVVTRTGHCMILGCLHRYVGGMASNQHLKNNIMILKALAEDLNAPVVQVWALHALYLIADSGGPMFRGFVDQTLSLCMKLLLTVPRHHHEVFHCIGKCLSALITAVGPELNGTNEPINAVRNTCISACVMMHASPHGDWISQSEAVQSFQQVHMFAAKHVNLTQLVPELVRHLGSRHLLLRQSAIDCLRQLCQRETGQVCRIARQTQEGSSTEDDLWLAQVLLDMLDVEKDAKILSGIQLILQSLLQYAVEHHLSGWFAISREILTTSEVGAKIDPDKSGGLERDGDDEDDEEEFRTKNPGDAETKRNNSRWLTRVYAVNCLRKLIRMCKEMNSYHFDVMRARRERLDALILHLPDLVRMAFMGATSDSDGLRMAGLDLLFDVIVYFAGIEEPEFPGHGILEQYQANVGAALRPAFAADTPPNITAKACDVCSRWIASGVARDIKDLRRVYQLLVQSLDKLRISLKDAKIPYSEASVTLEKLSILKAWAEIYVDAMRRQKQYEELLALVQPHVASLSRSWLAAIRDQALLSLPSEYLNQMPAEGGAFYSVESIDAARKVYQNSWLPILYATVIWWSSGGGYENVLSEKPDGRLAVQDGGNLGLGTVRPGVTPPTAEEINRSRFNLFFGTAMEALCQLRNDDVSDDESVITCLKAAQKVLELDWSKLAMCGDPGCPKEILNVMHRIVLTRENPLVQLEALNVVKTVLQAATDFIQQENRKKMKDSAGDGPSETVDTLDVGEGGASGEIVVEKSVVFAAAEVFFCILIRKFPSLNPALKSVTSHPTLSTHQTTFIHLAASTVKTLPSLLSLCSHHGTLAVLPVILHILLTSLRQLVDDDCDPTDDRCVALVDCLRFLSTSSYLSSPQVGPAWVDILRSTVLRLTDFAKTVKDRHQFASVTLLQATAVIILSGPEQVSRVENVFYPTVNMLKQYLSPRNEPTVQVAAIQTLGRIFLHGNRPVASAFIRHLAPDLLVSVTPNKPGKATGDGNLGGKVISKGGTELTEDLMVTSGGEVTETMDDVKMEVKSLDQVILVIERLRVLEMVVEAAEPAARDRVLAFVAPVFIENLQEPSAVQANDALARLHAFCLNRLQRMAPTNPEGFRGAVAKNPELKRKLELALSAQSTAHRTSQLAANSTPKTARRAAAVGGDTPSIKLKMDFTNFAAS